MTYLGVCWCSVLCGGAVNWVWGVASCLKSLGVGFASAAGLLAGVFDIGWVSWGTSLGMGTFLACNAMKFFHDFSIIIELRTKEGTPH